MPSFRRGRAHAAVPWLVLVLLALIAAPARAQSREDATSTVFRRYADRTVRVQVSEVGSAAKASVGTGFYVDAAGHLVTNYHVVAALVTEPARYRAESTDARGDTLALRLLAVDVVNDLAVLASPRRDAAFFALADERPPQGARLYALGHPRDLGLSIVEGTYNGLLEHTLYPRIHFTGSLNPGMSGGPTVDERGTVIGVNVSTGGDELSFLVPATYAVALLERARAARFAPVADPMADVARQIHAYQEGYAPSLFTARTPTVTLGRFTLPTRPAPFFRCWADVERGTEQPYEVVDHRCSTDDQLYVSDELSSGTVEMTHRVLTSTRLSATQFAALYTQELKEATYGPYGDEEHVTDFACQTRNVRVPAGPAVAGASQAPERPLNAARGERVPMRVQLCVRGYRRLAGLYDAVLRAAALTTAGSDGRRDGVVTTLTMTGVSFANVQRLTARYLESIAWRR